MLLPALLALGLPVACESDARGEDDGADDTLYRTDGVARGDEDETSLGEVCDEAERELETDALTSAEN